MVSQTDYKLAALDMDGTLLNSRHETSSFTRDIIARAAEVGKFAAISTGRCLSELREHMEELPGIRYIICENGGCVYDVANKAFISNLLLTEEETEAVLLLSHRFDLTRQCFIRNQSYLECTDEEDLKRHNIYDFAPVFRKGSVYVDDLLKQSRENKGLVEKINLYFKTAEDRADFRKQIESRFDLILADSIGIGLEVSPAGATKEQGLIKLCDHLHIPVSESMAVGDGGNDLEIMRAAGLSVAMANAIDEVMALADVVTDDNDHDGAAKAVLKYLIGENK